MTATSPPFSAASSLGAEFPRTADYKYKYGTAGFRDKATVLSSVMVRSGMLAALRSLSQGGKPVGVMVTASHNASPDNGVKLVDPSGEMMNQDWEALATQVANAPEAELEAVLANIHEQHVDGAGALPQVFVGYDTRSHSVGFAELVTRGAQSLGATVRNFGLVTTPQLHFMVRQFNVEGNQTPDLDCYFKTLADAFKELHSLLTDGSKLAPTLVDCAAGVGGVAMKSLIPAVNDLIDFEVINDVDPNGIVNESCGAEHVQKKRVPPRNFDATKHVGRKFASMDGDADRLVYFFVGDDDKLHLLDGDKIIALFTTLLQHLIKNAGIDLSLGIVQTAYANGASTDYISQSLGVSVDFTATGVKHLHHKAVEFDVGVYFEANGHGTVVFSDAAIAKMDAAESNQSVRCLKLLTQLINQAVGDALSDMLTVELVLAWKHWTLADWSRLYDDLPSRMLKVSVKDRTAIKTTNAERTCVAPQGLQAAVDALVAQVPRGRSFVRPSGTEDVVRVYAEATTQDKADQLADDVSRAVWDSADGQGPRP